MGIRLRQNIWTTNWQSGEPGQHQTLDELIVVKIEEMAFGLVFTAYSTDGREFSSCVDSVKESHPGASDCPRLYWSDKQAAVAYTKKWVEKELQEAIEYVDLAKSSLRDREKRVAKIQERLQQLEAE